MVRKIETPHIKYVFTDVVGFAKKRSVEAQADILQSLNDITLNTLQQFAIDNKSRILLPSGDGICVALVQPREYDIHLRFALELIRKVDIKNSNEKDQSRQFSIRVGVNENTDNIVKDINGRRNVAGSGINLAQRVMDHGDGGQILVGQTVHDVLVSREKYTNAFRSYSAADKHKQPFFVFHYILQAPGLNIDPPSRLAPAKEKFPTPRIVGYIAYYIAHATRNRDFLKKVSQEGRSEHAALVALHYLALDSIERKRTSQYEQPIRKSFGEGKHSFPEMWKYYKDQDWWVLYDFANAIEEKYLQKFEPQFEQGSFGTIWLIPNEEVIAKLKTEFPKWWAEVESGAGQI